VGRRDVQPKLVDQARKPRRLSLREVKDQARERGRVDDRVLEGALQAAADEPRVEGVVAVLDEHRALREAEKPASGVLELRRADEHRAVDVVALPRIRVDRRAAVDESVEERKRLLEREALGADLEDEERCVARRLDVEGDKLRGVERGRARDLGGVDRDLLPCDQLASATRLQIKTLRAHVRAVASARRAHLISSPLSARRISTAAP
jgi:hypothetical protein